MAEIRFIRHGESAANAGGATEDPGSILLTQFGHAQARKLSLSFTTAPDLVITSSYIRTQQTAAPTLERFPGTPQEIWPVHELAYLDPSRYKNTTRDQRQPHRDAFWKAADPYYIDGRNAESFCMALDRIKDMIERLKILPQKNIAVFCHEQFIQTMMMAVTHPELSPREMMKKFNTFTANNPVPNGSILKARADKDGFRLLTPRTIPLDMSGFSGGPDCKI